MLNTILINFSEKPLNLVLSPSPCVYRETVLNTLEKHSIPYRVSFTSQSYAAKISAVKAGLGITVLPQNMVPKDFFIQRTKILPELPSTHALMLKKSPDNHVFNSFEQFILNGILSGRVDQRNFPSNLSKNHA